MPITIIIFTAMDSSSALECPICQQSLLPPSSPPPSPQFASLRSISSSSAPVCTPCGHLFHKACISEWFRFRRRQHQNDNTESTSRTTFRCSCPTCRKSIAYHKLIRVYLPSTSPSPPPPSTPETFEPSLSVAEHVRRFNQRTLAPAPEPERSSSAQSNSQLYNEFFTIYNAINEDDFADAQSTSTNPTSSTTPASSPFACQNFDCIALQSVYQVLSKEFKILQRRLTLEMEVSKMKSVVVAGLQRDLSFCRKTYQQGALISGDLARTIGIIVISVFAAWFFGCAALFIFKPF